MRVKDYHLRQCLKITQQLIRLRELKLFRRKAFNCRLIIKTDATYSI